MTTFVFILMGLALLGVLASLVLGLTAMARGGSVEAAARSNKMMRLRVWMQAVALALFAVGLLLSRA